MSDVVQLPRNWPMFGYREWKTKDGSALQYKDIDLTHLQNIKRMLARQGANHSFAANAAFGYSGGDMAEMLASQSADHHSSMAHKYLRHVELLEEYIAWREENNYVFHAPKVEWDKTA